MIKHAIRSLLKAPGFLAVAVAILALGIGAATSIFGLLDHLAFRPLPFREPGRLVAVWRAVEGQFQEGQFLGPDFEEVEAGSRSFESLAMACPSSAVLEGPEGPTTLTGVRMTRRFLETLGVAPILGRAAFTRDEDRYGGPSAVILTFETWRLLFSEDPGVVGKAFTVDGKSARVVGVLPRGFQMPTLRLRGADVFVPLALTPGEREERGANFEVVGRLAMGVTRDQSGAELRALAGSLGWGKVSLRVDALSEGLRRPYLPMLSLVSMAVALLVLIACANVSSLLLTRGSARTTEFALRAALGAQPRVLVKQVMTESALIGGGGLLAGVALSLAFSKLLATYLGLSAAPPLNPVVLGLSALATAAATLLSGAAPAWHASRFHPASALKEGPGRSSRSAFRASLVATEVALALCLLIGAGLLGRSLQAQLRADPGFDAGSTLVGSLSLPTALFTSPESRLAFARQLEERLKGLPDTDAAGLALPIPLVNAGGWGEVRDEATGRTVKAWRHFVSPGAPAALGLRLQTGRALRAGETQACLVSRPLAEALWPDEDPLGRRLEKTWTVVGVVEGTREHSLREPLRAQYFIPLEGDLPFLGFLLRTRGDPSSRQAAVRSILREISPRLSADGMTSLAVAVRRNADHAERSAGLLAAFAFTALLLTALGVYGATSFLVVQRTREIGVRMALGATVARVLGLVLGHGMRVTAAGAICGLGAAAGLTRLLRSQLEGVGPLDPPTYALATLVLCVVSLVASTLPALRAARVDPVAALRSE